MQEKLHGEVSVEVEVFDSLKAMIHHIFSMPSLSRSVLETIVYYDVMDFPLTLFETWKYLILSDEGHPIQPIRLDDVWAVLETEELQKKITSSQGLYFLRGREELVAKRLSRTRRSVSYIKRVQRLGRFLRFVPFVRMVGLTGSVSMKNAKRGSDWDLFISLAPGHIWTGRLFVAAALHLAGKRRHGRYVRERACLNFWVTSESLEIPLKDLFSSHEYIALVPIYGAGEYRDFRMRNAWIRAFRPQYAPTSLVPLWCLPDTQVSFWLRVAGEKIFFIPALERLLARMQRRKIERNPKTSWSGSLVTANEHTLIFLPKPRGPRIFEKFKKRLGRVSVEEA